GFLVGAENQGLVGMFTMMNNARIAVGLEGVAVAERAFQAARAYAAERVQGRAPDAEAAGPINRHPDVRRMLASMHAKTEAARALTYAAGAQVDLAHAGVEGAEERVALLTPLVKSWATDTACEVADTGIQIHGGMGYVEETGAAQYLRDVRVTRIYEGTNGIQAADLVFRKVIRDGGEAVRKLIAENRALAPHLTDAHDAVAEATDWVIANPDEAAGASVPYQDLLARVTAGSLLFGCAQKLSGTDMGERKAAAARFFEAHELSGAKGLANTVRNGSESLRTYPQSVLDRP
ncbi:MAG: acyl-CoA dehydrogenase, partial [Pseudomonadota bacterium]